MIFSEAPGAVYRGQGTYSKIGYGLSVYQSDYFFSQPTVQLLKGAAIPYKEYSPLVTTERYSWIGTTKNDQVADDEGYYWDSELGDWAGVPAGYGFVLRPMIFNTMFSGRDFVASYRVPASTTKRPHIRDQLNDTAGNLHICPLFMTEKGLALPDFASASVWNMPAVSTSATQGNSPADFDLCVHSAPNPIVGLCFVGLMSSEATGGLINQRTESLATAFIGQIDGSFFLDVVGRPLTYFELSFVLDSQRSTMLAYLPWSGKTIKEVCSVKNIRGEIKA